MIIRQATTTDIDSIMQLVALVVPMMQAAGNTQWDASYPNAAVFEADIANGHLWVADVDGSVAGVIAIMPGQEPEYAQVPGWDITEPAIVAHRLAVSPNHRGLGIAAALLQQCEHEAVRLGISLIRMDTNTVNRATQNLFMKMGYHLGGEVVLNGRPNLRFMAFEKRI
jgi:GNAT superfamily N-acetyltransferase